MSCEAPAQPCEAELRVSEERLRLALEGTRDGLWDWDLVTGTTYRSQAWFTMLGYSGAEAAGDLESARALIHPDDLEHVIAASRNAILHGQSYEVEARMRCADGSWRWILSRGRVSGRDAHGNAIRISGINADIHRLKQSEHELLKAKEEAEARESVLMAIMEQASDGIALADLQGRYQFVNPAFCAMTGYAREALLAMKVFDLIDPEQSGKRYFDNREAMDGKANAVTLRHQSGRRINVEIVGKQIFLKDQVLVLGTVRDVTDRLATEAKLRESENLFNLAFQFLPIGLGITTLEDGRVLAVNQFYTDTFGYTMADLQGHTSLDRNVWVNPEDRAAIVAAIEQGQAVIAREVQLRKKDQALCWASFSACRVFIKGTACLLSVTEDVTAKKAAHDFLRESEERFTKAFNFMPIGSCISAFEDGRFIAVNSFIADIFGYQEDEMLGHSALGLGIWANPDDRAAIMARVAKGQNVYAQEELFGSSLNWVGSGRLKPGRSPGGRQVEIQLPGNEVGHGDEVPDRPIAASLGLGSL